MAIGNEWVRRICDLFARVDMTKQFIKGSGEYGANGNSCRY